MPHHEHAAPSRNVVELLAGGVLPQLQAHLAAVGLDECAPGPGGRLASVWREHAASNAAIDVVRGSTNK